MTNEEKLLRYLKKVTADLAETRKELDDARGAAAEPIAVIGMGCRLPGGVADPEALWRLVADGGDAVTGLPEGRGWDTAAADAMGLRGGFVADADRFDAALFGISPREALTMDPQQRLALETAWSALEDARIDPLSLRGHQTGVFLGAGSSAYATAADLPDTAEGHLLTGSAASVVSGRVAYVFGLKGPAITVDTACSSSLVAIHLACQSLRAGESETALAGGVSVLAGLGLFSEFGKQGALAGDGRCKAFSDAADGTGWGEGAGVLLLARLSDALRDGRRVHAVIRGSAINSDGASSGLTAPNGPSQRKVITAALAAAGLAPSEVDAVEAHGTGTRLGDPIEAQALIETYGQDRERPLWLGSVKSNIGHTQAAAGVAGVIKTVLALRRGLLPPTLHVDEPASHIDWTEGNIELLTETQVWPATGRPRRAAVSAFGMSGTNAHAIIEQAPAVHTQETQAEPATPVPCLVSARSVSALRAQAERLVAHLDGKPRLGVLDVARSLATSRAALPHRAAVLAGNRVDLLRGLRELAAGGGQVLGTATEGRLAFLFTGQGSQRAGMGRELSAAFPVFAEVVDDLSARLGGIPWDDQERLDRTRYAQAALFAFEVALFRLTESWGLTPDYVLGHSIGELAAAHVAGVLSLDDACTLVSARGRLMEALPAGGAMLAAEVSEVDVPAGVDVAAVNGPTSLVVSGTVEEISALEERWRSEGRRVKRLAVSHAFHSKLMEPMLAEFATVAESLTYHQPAIRLPGEVTDPAYWVRQVRGTVRFADAVATLRQDGVTSFVELGPDNALSVHVEGAVPLQRRNRDEVPGVLGGLAAAHVAGVRVDWTAVFAPWGGRLTDLPTYPFEGDRYWLPERASTAHADPAEERFWRSVEVQDTAAVATTLGLDPGNGLATVLPALHRWRKGRRDTTTVDSWRYRVTWAPLTDLPAPRALGTWLVVTPSGATDPAAEALRDHGANVVELALPAEDDRWEVAELVLDAVTEAGGVDGVLSLLGGRQPHPEYGPTATGLAATVVLLQALGVAAVDAPLWIATRGAVAVGRADAAPDPMLAQLWGAGRVAALELPGRWGGLVDLPEILDNRASVALAAVLAGGSGEDQVAVRATGAFGRRLHRAPAAAPDRHWRPTGPVLITGGTGALGRRVARWLAGRGATDLVVTSRSGPSATGAAELVTELAELGVTATVVACDVTDRDALASVLAGHPVTAVMHTAGVAESASLTDSTLAEFADVLKAKVGGARNLDELLPDAEAFVLFSSIGGIWGSGNAAAYGAANAYLDALAENRRARGRSATAVAWGPWAGEGMAAGETAEHIAKWGLAPMAPELGLIALGQALDADETALVVSAVDWPVFAPIFCTSRPSPLIAAVPEAAAVLAGTGRVEDRTDARTRWAGRLTTLPAAERADLVLDLVRTEVAAVLGHRGPTDVAPGLPFSDLGIDSLTAVELRDRLTAATGLRLPASLAFDYPKPSALAAHLLTELVADAAPEGVPVTGATVTQDAEEDTDAIAIIGMACRYPGGIATPEMLWELLANGGEALSPFPADRGWNTDELFGREPGASYVQAGGFLAGAADFDAAFFGISPREAVAMDPQQRLLLETSWEAFELAGVDPRSLAGSRTGVFVGSNAQDYGYVLTSSAEDVAGQLVGGTTAGILSGRLAYTFGLEGPAVTVDTACSSSLVALHMAASALRAGECTMALAAGVTVMSTPGPFVEFSTLSGLSEDGRCRAFADAADGTGWGEGAGVLLVERLSDARRNGHPVLAVIRASAVNSDGASNGLTAPNGPAQQRVIRAALDSAGLAPSEVDAVEAHGTGTTLGDPIEAQALLATYGQDRTTPLWLGSVKSNLGHTQAASGVAGVMKVVLALRNGLLPKTLHVDAPTTHVDWSAGSVELLTESRPWVRGDRPRRAGVSSFGASGTNAHVIIEESAEAPAPRAGAIDAPVAPVPLVLSASSEQALRAQAARLRAHLAAHPDLPTADLGATLAARAGLAHRGAVVGDRAELLDGLAALAAGTPSAAVVSGSAINSDGAETKPVFVFPGQGSQWAGMAVDLLDASPVFLAAFESCEHALAPHVDFVPSSVLRGDDAWLDRVEVVQPLLFAVMVSLAALWRSCGVEPVAVVGHSQGEVAAAVVCGALSLADAAKVVALRSLAIADELSGRGGMVSVALPADTVRARLPHWHGSVELAAVNGPASVVVSGTPAGLADLVATFTAEGARAKHIPVDYASHSAQVAAIRDRLRRDLAGIAPRSSDIPFYSAVTGEQIDTAGLDSEYWYTNLRETVRFDAATTALLDHGHRLFIEVGPHPVLAMAVRETAADTDTDARVIGTLRRDEDGPRRFHTSLAEAHVHGARPDFTTVFPDGALVDLPTYAFQRKRYWPTPHQWTAQPPPVSTAAEDRFWSAVASGDAAEAADVLDLASGGALAPLLPALSAWRRGLRERAAVDAWRYTVTWQPVAEPETPILTGRWLVVTPDADHPVAARVTAALRERLATVDTVVVDPATADAADLSERLRDGGWTGVLSLLALDTAAHPAHPVLPSGLAATLTLLHALLDADPGAPLWCATQGAVAAAQDAPTSPEQAQVWGLGRVAALEHPRHWGGLVDLPENVDARAAARLVAAVTRGDGEDQLAVRPAGLLARRLVRATGGGPVRTWRPRGAVLVTGGTGAIGGHVARWLADNGAEDLVLVSRRGADAPGAAELARELASRGAAVTFAACDVADRGAVAVLLDDLRDQGLAVRTVMHTAGASTLERLEHTGVADLADLMGGKVAGARNLTELLDPAEVDAIVHFSSIAGVWGVGRHGGYAAGNAYLDALAQRSRADGVPALSVAWGPWDGGGMVAATEVEPMLRRGVPLIEPEPAVRALQQALDHDDTFVAAAEVDWYRFTPAFTVMRPSPLIGELAEVKLVTAATPARAEETAADAGLAATLAGQTPAERERTLVGMVRASAAAVLRHDSADDVAAGRPFREAGFDSLTAVELRDRLAAATGLRLPVTLVFDHPTPAVLARYLLDRLAPEPTVTGQDLPTPDELDRLDAALSALAGDDVARVRVVVRLEALLAKQRRTVADDLLVRLGAASNDELFNLVDRDLGVN